MVSTKPGQVQTRKKRAPLNMTLCGLMVKPLRYAFVCVLVLVAAISGSAAAASLVVIITLTDDPPRHGMWIALFAACFIVAALICGYSVKHLIKIWKHPEGEAAQFHMRLVWYRLLFVAMALVLTWYAGNTVIARSVNAFYFPNQPNRIPALYLYLSAASAAICVVEAIFLIGLRRARAWQRRVRNEA